MKSEWLIHHNHKILYINCANLDEKGLRAEIDEVGKLIAQQPKASLRTLTDIRGIITSPGILDIFKESTASYRDYVFKEAIIGVSGPKKVLLDIVSRFSGVNPKPFDDLEEAKDWLVSDL